MGAGIAQLGCAAGMRTLLHDPLPAALEQGLERVHGGLAKWVEKGVRPPARWNCWRPHASSASWPCATW